MASPTLASPLWLIRELSRQGRRLFYARNKNMAQKEKAAIAAFLFGFLLELTSLSLSDERLSETFSSPGIFSSRQQHDR
jgi:hypothetical protein